MRRIALILLGIVVVAAIAFRFLGGQANGGQAALEGERVRAEPGTMTAIVNATGNVEANQQVSLSFRSAGRVAEVLVEEGERVEEGDILAQLETTDLEFAVAQAESNVEIQEARLRQLEIPPSDEEIQAAEAQLASAQESLARLQAGPTAEDIRAAEAQLASARENLARVQAGASAEDIRAAEAQLASARANLAQLQQGADPDDVEAARANLAAAQSALAELEAGPDASELIAAQAELDRAIAAVKQAQAAYDQVSYRADISSLPQSLELEQATINYQQAQANYDAIAAGPSPDQIEQARANVAQAQAQLDNLLQGNDSASISSAQAQVVQAEATLAELRRGSNAADIRSAEAQVAQAEAALAELLRGSNAADIRAAEAQVAQAESALQDLQEGADTEEVNVARANLRQAELQLQQAENDLAAATLTAPFDGTVATLGANKGELVTSAQPMVTLADLSSFLIEVEVDEVDIGEVELDDPVTILVDSLPDLEIPGEIEYISPIPNEDQGVITYPVRIRLEQEEAPGLRVGMSANVDIITQTLEEVLLVPSRAITVDRETGEVYVLKIVDDAPVRTIVRTGLRNSEMTQIVEGDVEPGDTLLIQTISSQERLQMQLGG